MTTCLGKNCSFGLPRVPFVNCCQFMYLAISLLVLRAGCGIWLYRFLIIAYLFTSVRLLVYTLTSKHFAETDMKMTATRQNDINTSKSSFWRHARESSYTPHVRRHFLAPIGFTEIPVGYARKWLLDPMMLCTSWVNSRVRQTTVL